MKAKLTKLESIVQGYVAKDSVSGENYRYLQENMETVLYAIQQASKVEEMQKALDRIHTDSTDAWAVGYSLRVLQALKGGETK